jgi:hypothetical protein
MLTSAVATALFWPWNDNRNNVMDLVGGCCLFLLASPRAPFWAYKRVIAAIYIDAGMSVGSRIVDNGGWADDGHAGKLPPYHRARVCLRALRRPLYLPLRRRLPGPRGPTGRPGLLFRQTKSHGEAVPLDVSTEL